MQLPARRTEIVPASIRELPETLLAEAACPVSDDVLGRLYAAGEPLRDEILAAMPLAQRAQLAVFCNRRGHLRELALAAAATCRVHDLIDAAGSTPVGTLLFDQTRQAPALQDLRRGARRISLAGRRPAAA
jgi:hypothetical protein